MRKYFILLIPVILMVFTSCISRKNLNYFQDVQTAESKEISSEADVEEVRKKMNKEIKIRPYDVIGINVFTEDEKLNKAFQATSSGQSGGGRGGGSQRYSYFTGYSVSEDGYVRLPILGKIKVLNLTLSEAEDKIQEKLKKFVYKPFVQIKFITYKVYVLGQVKSPGLKRIESESATIMEAISLSGDLQQFANRENVKVFRGETTDPTVYSLDLTSVSSMKSEGFYLQPYDIIYVEPMRRSTLVTNIQTVNTIIGGINAAVGIFSIYTILSNLNSN